MLCFSLLTTAKAATIALGTGTYTSSTGVIFSFSDQQPTGTGVIDPFLRLQNTPNESGINTSLNFPGQPAGVPLDDKDSPNYTHDLNISTLQQIPGSQITGADASLSYYKFLCDVNQLSASPLLNFNVINLLVTSKITDVSTFNSTFGISGNSFVPVGLDALGGVTLQVDYSLNHGSGSGDFYMYVPVDKIGSSGYLYLQNQNGTGDVSIPGASNDGFEEWNGQTGPSPAVPDSATTMTLLGIALAGIEGLRRKLGAC